VLLVGALAGCRRAPTFNILGSFFPSWLMCLFAGIVLAAVANRLFVRFAPDKEIFWPVVVYPCLALFFACALWLVFFS
jgi:Na+/glutamate symporter